MKRWDPIHDGIPSNSLPPCERFTRVLVFGVSPEGHTLDVDPACAVCDHLEITHPAPGRRSLTIEEVHRLRLALIESTEA
jgi:hypothetical protein